MQTVKLKEGAIAEYSDGALFIVETGTLDVQFIFPKKTGDYFLVASQPVTDDGKHSAFLPKDGRAQLNVREGTLHLSVKRYVGGVLTNSYAVEPLTVKSVDDGLELIPQLAAMRAEHNALAFQMEAGKSGIMSACEAIKANADKQFNELKKTLQEAIKGFLAYAYAEYKNDVQLNSNSLGVLAFAQALGLNVDASDVSEIIEKGERL